MESQTKENFTRHGGHERNNITIIGRQYKKQSPDKWWLYCLKLETLNTDNDYEYQEQRIKHRGITTNLTQRDTRQNMGT